VLGVGAERGLGQLEGRDGFARLESLAGPLGDGAGAARQADEVGVHRVGRRPIELARRAVLEPSGVVLPDRPHAPRDLAVALTDLELRRQRDFAHEGVDVAALVHAADGLVMDVQDRAAQAIELAANEPRAFDRVVVSDQEQLGLEVAHELE